MKPIDAHGRFAVLCDSNFKDWQLPDADPALVSQPDWPGWATAFASLTGELEDLADDADDATLLKTLRQGWGLYQMGALSQEQLEAETENVLREVLQWGDAIESKIETATRDN